MDINEPIPEPRRRFVLRLEFQADHLDEVLRELSEVKETIRSGIISSFGGGYSSRIAWRLNDDPTWTHEKYMEVIEESLAKLRGADHVVQ